MLPPLCEILKNSEILNQASRIFIGFSGGIDSAVLLHALNNIENLKSKIFAIHINHQLQDAAADFEKFCKNFCENLNIKIIILNPSRLINSGESLEAYAREVRYDCFRSCLENSQDFLITAHHIDDQAETFLLQLFRGAGLAGLSAMPVLSDLGAGKLYRPLLNISRNNIKNYAEFFNLKFIEDPSNLDLNLDRNFLRHEIFPKLKQRYLGLEKNIARSARHCASAQKLLDQQAGDLLKKIGGELGEKLPLKLFWDLKKSEQILILRAWLFSFKIILSEAQIEILLSQKRLRFKNNKKNKNNFCEIREFQDYFYCLFDGLLEKNTPPLCPLERQNILWVEGFDPEKTDLTILILKTRQGGEIIKLAGSAHHKTLKKLFQERAIPPWVREQVKLLYQEEILVGVVFPEGFVI